MGSLGTTPELLLLVRRPNTHRRPPQGPFSTRGASTLPTLLQSGRQVSVVSWSGPGDQTGLPAPRSPSRSPALDPRLQLQFPELTRPPCRPPRSCIQGSLSAMPALLPLSRHFPSLLGATPSHLLRKPSLIAGHLLRRAQVPSAIYPWPPCLPVPGLWQHGTGL